MPRKSLFVPRLHDKNVRRLYHYAHRLNMPVSKLLNLIVATSLEQLDEVNDPDEWDTYVLVRPEEEQGDHSLCSNLAENSSPLAVAPGETSRIHQDEHLAAANIHED